MLVIAFSIFFFPASMVLPPLGAAGTVPMMMALILFGFWAASVLLGLHDVLAVRHPGHLAIGALLFATLISYAALNAGWTGSSTVAARAAAGRWLLLLLASLAIIFVVGATVRSVAQALRLVRALLAGATFCSLVAAVQFVFQVNPMDWIALAMPGFEYNGGDTVYQVRGALLRVAGSTFTPIELGVVSSMMLPLSIWRLLVDNTGRHWVHGLQTSLLVFAIAATVSRSGVLGIVVGMATFLPFLPRIARRWAVLLMPFVVVGLFLLVPGLVSTLGNALNPPPDDPSITTRTSNYARVEEIFEADPWVGVGPGNYMPSNALNILDNQYLNSLVTLGAVGLVAIVLYLCLPAVTTIYAARVTASPELRSLGGAVAAGLTVASVGSLTFDSLSFPVFALVYPVLVGLGGAIWSIVAQELASPAERSETDGSLPAGLTGAPVPIPAPHPGGA